MKKSMVWGMRCEEREINAFLRSVVFRVVGVEGDGAVSMVDPALAAKGVIGVGDGSAVVGDAMECSGGGTGVADMVAVAMFDADELVMAVVDEEGALVGVVGDRSTIATTIDKHSYAISFTL